MEVFCHTMKEMTAEGPGEVSGPSLTLFGRGECFMTPEIDVKQAQGFKRCYRATIYERELGPHRGLRVRILYLHLCCISCDFSVFLPLNFIEVTIHNAAAATTTPFSSTTAICSIVAQLIA